MALQPKWDTRPPPARRTDTFSKSDNNTLRQILAEGKNAKCGWPVQKAWDHCGVGMGWQWQALDGISSYLEKKKYEKRKILHLRFSYFEK